MPLATALRETRRPIVGELKIASDKDPYTGLVQALAGAAQLVSPHQRARLSKLSRPLASIEEEPLLDVYVLLANFPRRAVIASNSSSAPSRSPPNSKPTPPSAST